MKSAYPWLLLLTSGLLAVDEGPHVTVKLLANRDAIAKEESFLLGVQLRMKPHWHTYWENPGSSGLPTTVTWKVVDGLEIGPLLFPLPERFVDSAGFVTFGYKGEVLLLARAHYSGSADTLKIGGRVDWLECRDVCLPGSDEVSLVLPVNQSTPAREAMFASWLKQVPEIADEQAPFTYGANLEMGQEVWKGTLTVTPKDPAAWSSSPEDYRLLPGPNPHAELKTSELMIQDGRLVFNLGYDAWGAELPEAFVVSAVLDARIQGQSRPYRLALFPPGAELKGPELPAGSDLAERLESGAWKEMVPSFEITNTASGYQNVSNFSDFLAGKKDAGFSGMGLGWVILLVLVGGLALNLTPCVLPLIPINIAIIGAGAQAGSRARGFALGGTYGLGIALVYGLLGLAVILGISSTFGAINATVWFNAGIAVLFVILGLAMFDVIVIDFTRFQNKLGAGSNTKSGFLLAFVMGSVSALLAGACVAPVVISTIVYAQDQFAKGSTLAVTLPFLLGLGMALPWPFAGAGLSFLPRPGQWMVRVKQLFGVLIFAFAIYYGYLAYGLMQGPKAPAEEASGVWVHSLSEGLKEAEIEGKPVLLDFWATWCKNCLAMDRTTLKDPEILEALESFVPVKVQAENLSEPETAEMLEYFGVQGLPTYVILTPR